MTRSTVAGFYVLSFLAGAAQAVTCTYTDGTWDTQPGENDDIVISSGDLTWGDSLPVKVGSWTQGADYTGTVTFDTGLETFTVTGDVTLAGGTWTHAQNSSRSPNTETWTTGRGYKQLIVSVGGNMTIAAHAKIDVTGKGYPIDTGPGHYRSSGLTSGGAAASHGGSGAGQKQNQNSGKCYGSARHPDTIGSGGFNWSYGSSGGGAVRLDVAKTLAIDGLIAADGSAYRTASDLNAHYSGAGGSVWITAGAFAGSGIVRADGGAATASCAGGGGRIAIHLTGEGSLPGDCPWTVTAYPGAAPDMTSFPGTIYFETPAHEGAGILWAKGSNPSVGSIGYHSNRNYGTGLTADEKFGELRMTGRTYVRIPSNTTVSLEKVVSVNDAGTGAFNFITANVWTNKIVLAGGALKVPEDHSISNYTLVMHFAGSSLRLGDGEGNGNLVIRDGGEWQINSPVAWTGDVHVMKGGIISHIWQSTKQKPLDLTVEGDLTIDEGGAVDVEGRGRVNRSGPGVGTVNQSGSSHGGCGECGNVASYGHPNGKCYGSIVSPVECGSGGMWTAHTYKTPGGGAAKVTVSRTFTLNGLFTANGGTDDYHTGSGGSAWIIAGRFTGSGLVSADGGTTRVGGGKGGGGRVAVWLTDETSTFDDFSGKITAYGGKNLSGIPGAAPGTVYLKTAAQGVNEGLLVIDNGPAKKLEVGTQITEKVTDTVVGSVDISANGRLEIHAGMSLSFRGDWVNDGKLVCEEDSVVECLASDEPCVVSGTNAFFNFTCDAPGATLAFSPQDSLFSIMAGGKLVLRGGEDDPLRLVSGEESRAWALAVDPEAKVEAEYLDIADSDASQGAPVVARNSQGVRCENWGFVTVVPGETLVWTGEAGNDLWSDALNWNPQRAPVETDHVEIPAGCALYPKLVESVSCLSVAIAAGASFDLAHCDISLNALTNAGSLVARSSERITVAGDFIVSPGGSFVPAHSTLVLQPSSVASVATSGAAFNAVEMVFAGAQIALSDSVSCDRLSVIATVSSALAIAPGSVVKAKTAAFAALAGGEACLTLASSVPGSPWKLDVRDAAVASGVLVSDCDASGGVKIVTESPSADYGGNVNWVFCDVLAKWIGEAGAEFSDDANWSTGKAPGRDDTVVIDTAADITVSQETSVGELYLGGGAESVCMRVTAPLSVAGSLMIATNATLTMDAPSSLGHSLLVFDGGVLTHSKNGSTEPYRIDLEIGANVLVGDAGKIDVKGRGYGKGHGPGSKGTKWAAGSHGGRGSGTLTGPCYGNVFCPTNCGSSGSSHNTYGAAGGGAVKLSAAGTIEVNGRIDAEGGDDIVPQATSGELCYYSGAGGSIWLEAARLEGRGLITANGGLDKHTSNGGGGRIAVYLTAATEPAASLSITCYGGRKHSELDKTYPTAAPGSIYLQGAGTPDRYGTITYDNGTKAGGSLNNPTNVCCDLPAKTLSEDYRAFRNAKIVIDAGAAVRFWDEKMRVEDVDLRKDGVLSAVDGTLWIRSLLHRDAKGWEGTLRFYDDDKDGVYGDVRWLAPGLFLIVR